MTASFGVAAFEAGDAGIDELGHRADLALYDAKRGGRNRVTWRTGEDHPGVLEPELAALSGAPAAAGAAKAPVWEIE